MSIPPQEAADALRNIEQAQRQSATAYSYRRFSPHLFLWGAIWIVGYASNYIRPTASLIWIPLVLAGIVASFWIGARSTTARTGASYRWRYGATALTIFLFVTAVFAMLPPKSEAQIGGFLADSRRSPLRADRNLDPRHAYLCSLWRSGR